MTQDERVVHIFIYRPLSLGPVRGGLFAHYTAVSGHLSSVVGSRYLCALLERESDFIGDSVDLFGSNTSRGCTWLSVSDLICNRLDSLGEPASFLDWPLWLSLAFEIATILLDCSLIDVGGKDDSRAGQRPARVFALTDEGEDVIDDLLSTELGGYVPSTANHRMNQLEQRVDELEAETERIDGRVDKLRSVLLDLERLQASWVADMWFLL